MSPLDSLRRHLQRVSRARAELADVDMRAKLAFPLRLPTHMRRFLRSRYTLDSARDGLHAALESRSARFLELVRTEIYERPRSPYLRLLRAAGCELFDLQRLVREHGLEPTLERLAREGVYLTSEEFKGRQPIVRGSLSFEVGPRDFDPPWFVRGFVTESSGTRGAPVRGIASLDWLAAEALATAPFLSAHDLLLHSHAALDVFLPGAGSMFLLQLAKLGIAPERWYALRVPFEGRLDAAYHHLTARETVLLARWFGPGFPTPELVALGDMEPVVRWLAGEVARGSSCCVRTVASNAARIARTASAMAVSLEGVTFIASGEPMTEPKRETIESTGARWTLLYGYSPGPVHVGYGCRSPSCIDDMHLNLHTLAVVEHERLPAGRDAPVRPLLFTTLHPAAAKLQLNVENGDTATLEHRECGCELGSAGLSVHIHHVRSFEKFTSEGLAYEHSDLLEALEGVLPNRFGGGPGDYQLLEEEDRDGRTRLTLLVDPQVGCIDEEAVLGCLEAELSGGQRKNRFTSRLWSQAGTLRLRRQAPIASARGKVLPLRIGRPSETTGRSAR